MRFLRSFVAAVALVEVLFCGAAWASEWKPFGLQIVTIRSLAAAPDLLCAGTQGAGVYCRDLTASAGSTWMSIGPAGTTITWLWIDPLNPQVMFAAAAGQANTPSLYRTLNGGGTWQAVDHFPKPGGLTPRAYAVHGVPGGVPIFAAGTSVWISHDRGDTWTLSSSTNGLDCLEVSPADPRVVWSGGETQIFSGFTIRSLDGGVSWQSVWDSSQIGDNQTADVAAHPSRTGLALTGHEGFVLRTETNGASFQQVLAAPSRFFLDWDGGNSDRAYAAGSPNGGTSHAFVSRDVGKTWKDVTGTVLAPRTVLRIEADETRLGVVYAATDSGVYRFYGGGIPVCLDARGGLGAFLLRPGPCGASTAVPVIGDVIAFDRAGIVEGDATVFLGEVECLASDADLSLITLDTPDPSAGRCLGIVGRLSGDDYYGFSSSGLGRRPLSGDCP